MILKILLNTINYYIKYYILLILLNTPMIWKIFIKILKNTIQVKNEKY